MSRSQVSRLLRALIVLAVANSFAASVLAQADFLLDWQSGIGGDPIIEPIVGGPSVLLTMDDLPSQPLDGLVHPAGVTFTFDLGPDLATYNATGPGNLTFVQDPSIEGSVTGVVGFLFDNPIRTLTFGVARNSSEDISVSLFDDADALVDTRTISPLPISSVPEGQFSYSGAPVSRAEMSFQFSDSTNLGRFALDNLAFAVPEPSGLLIGLSGMILLMFRRRRQ